LQRKNFSRPIQMPIHQGRVPDDHLPPKQRSSKKWIQEVVSSPDFRKGALTRKARKEGLTALEYAHKVLMTPDKYDLRTRQQAQFAVNVSPDD